MSWTSPRTWVAAQVVTAAQLNADIRDNENALRTGGIAIASQAALDFVYATSSSQFGVKTAGTARQGPRINAAGSAWEFAEDTKSLLATASSGTTTNASAENLVSIAMGSRLTILDTVVVVASISASAGVMTAPHLYNATDSVVLSAKPANALLIAGNLWAWTLRVSQQDLKTVYCSVTAFDAAGVDVSTQKVSTLSTNWTGAWSLAVRHDGMTAGGTGSWSAGAYRWAGQ